MILLQAIEVCSHVGEYGGREFKKSLIRSLLAKEDKQFRAELIQDLGRSDNLSERHYMKSDDEENYSSAEETL